MAEEIRVRMAPAPTGRFHIGSARTTLHNWLFARHHAGKFILRIEDTDQARSSRENAEDILDAIRWLGLDWDEGPEVGGEYGPYFQSQRLERYREAAQRLLEEGKAYPCFCTREELEARRKEMQRQGQPPRYDRRCRSLSPEERAKLEAAGRPKAIRFALPEEGVVAWEDLVRGHVAFENAALDDFVLVKSDGYPSYLLACAVDDAAMRISHVLRGEDLISGTPRQIHVYQALGLPLPRFVHLPLLLGPDRAKLSKRHGATALADYRDQGYLSDAVVNFIALLGWSPGDDREVLSREELIEAFSIDGIGKSGAVFDMEKLGWMNGVYLREMPPEDYVAAGRPFLERAGLPAGGFGDEYVTAALTLEQERAKTLGELPALTEFFFRDPASYEEKGEKKWFRREGAAKLLAAVKAALAGLETFDASSVEGAIRGAADAAGEKPGPAIHSTRLAVTGRTAGPGLFELLSVLGKERALGRLERALAHVQSR